MGDFGMEVEREDMNGVWSEVGRGRGVKEVEGIGCTYGYGDLASGIW
jgi:hypothetical protein